ncbi:MAG: exodeoxyribonuclease III [Spirochaetales bacterium]|nr:exodeoxyribonuclease III [Spirochaetales bacterium]
MTRITSWNVNGIRAAEKKGLFTWLRERKPDMLCLQETKAHPEQLSSEFLEQEGYHSYFLAADRKGYSGVALYSREKPLSLGNLGIAEFDCEGRVLVAEYPAFLLINAYFPNSQSEGARLSYKIEFCEALHTYCDGLAAEGKEVILCGDYNIAHKPIDLANPKSNEKNPGYLPEERAWMDTFLGSGYIDTFRIFHQEGGHYTWWTYRFQAREKNVGWRIDYHCITPGLKDKIKDALILSDVYGSDHCPVELVIS